MINPPTFSFLIILKIYISCTQKYWITPHCSFVHYFDNLRHYFDNVYQQMLCQEAQEPVQIGRRKKLGGRYMDLWKGNSEGNKSVLFF